jgi:hypothetical protein
MKNPFDTYFSADIETDGPIPGPYSMLSFGIVIAGHFDGTTFERVEPKTQTFYRELKPISEDFDQETASVSGLDRQKLLLAGADPHDAMTEAADWVTQLAGAGTPVLVAFPLSFDWSFLYWYFVRYSEKGSPFRFSSCLDIKTAYSIRARQPIVRSGASNLPRELRSSRPHYHHALDDAAEQAEIFANIMEWQP